MATPQTNDAAELALTDVAVSRETELRQFVTEGLDAVRASASLGQVIDALPFGDIAGLYDFDLLLPLSFEKAEFADDIFLATMLAAARATAEMLIEAIVLHGIGLTAAEEQVAAQAATAVALGEEASGIVGVLDITDPFVIASARQQAGNMVIGVREASRAAITEAVAGGVSGDLTRPQVARLIQQSVGLTPKDARALRNYREGLQRVLDGRMSHQAVTNRWTAAPKRFRVTSAADIERLADRYAKTLLKKRAINIARTETIRAANAGQIENWLQAIRDGLLPRGIRKVWVVTLDDRLCPLCAPLEGAVVAITEDFTSSEQGLTEATLEPLDQPLVAAHPPLHPHCRCVLVLEPIPL